MHFRFIKNNFLNFLLRESVTFADSVDLTEVPKSDFPVWKMLLLSNRIKLCSLAFTAARMYSSGPAAANKNPTVYFDIAADSQPLGRVTFEVRR